MILSDFPAFQCLPVKKKLEGCTLPKRQLILRSQIITLFLFYSPLSSTIARIEGRTTNPFHRNGEMSRFCLQKSRISAIEDQCFKSNRSVHEQMRTPPALLPSLNSRALPSDWTIVVMANSSNGPHTGGYTPTLFAMTTISLLAVALRGKKESIILIKTNVYQLSFEKSMAKTI